MGDRKRGDAPFLILKYLGENGPTSYEKISKDLEISQSTVENRIRKILIERHGLVRKLPNDKFALKWYTDEEDTANTLKKKLLRNPLPEELAGLIRKSRSEAKDVLIKYLPGYREPTSDEMASSAKTLYKMIILGALELPSKKKLFEKGIIGLSVEGIDQETLTDILEKRTSIDLNNAKSYLAEFPETRPEITFTEKHNWISCRVKWGEDVRMLLGSIDSWKQTAEIRIPWKYDKRNQGGRLGGRDIVSALEIAEELADLYVPSEKIIGFLLDVAVEPHGDLIVLATLKKYCQNALEVGQLDEKVKDLLIPRLIEAAFFTGDRNDFKERNIAFDIIEMLEARNEDIVDISSDYLDEWLNETPDDFPDAKMPEGPDAYRIAKWLSKDQNLRVELEQKLEDLIKKAEYSEQVSRFKNVLEQISQMRDTK
jgi:hypothetical protein